MSWDAGIGGPMRRVVEEDVASILSAELDWSVLEGRHVAVTGAGGMLASYLVESLLALNARLRRPIEVTALVRNVEKARRCFAAHLGDGRFGIRYWNYEDPVAGLQSCQVIVHAASIPRPDAAHPVDVIGPNEVGTWNLLRYAQSCGSAFEQFVFFSSGAIYGDGFLAQKPVGESYVAPVDQMSPASCYVVSKRAGENLCMSFMRQYGVPVKILRYGHTFGPGMDLVNDPRSFVSFVRSAVEGQDIVLRSSGDMVRHFCYVTDATRALFAILLKGTAGMAYNVANPEGGMCIADLAELVASLAPKGPVRVVRQAADGGCACSSPAHVPQVHSANLDVGRLLALGWRPRCSVREGFRRVVEAHAPLR